VSLFLIKLRLELEPFPGREQVVSRSMGLEIAQLEAEIERIQVHPKPQSPTKNEKRKTGPET
jgi:hypothetical protein